MVNFEGKRYLSDTMWLGVVVCAKKMPTGGGRNPGRNSLISERKERRGRHGIGSGMTLGDHFDLMQVDSTPTSILIPLLRHYCIVSRPYIFRAARRGTELTGPQNLSQQVCVDCI